MSLKKIQTWLQTHPGIFQSYLEGADLHVTENFSQKKIHFQAGDLDRVEEKTNVLTPGETYLAILWNTGRQVALSKQGFAFPPDFSNTGPLTLPNQVYCMQDYHNLLNQLKHLAAQEDRHKEALDLILVLIAILDGARAVGLELEEETREVDKILAGLESGQPSPPPPIKDQTFFLLKAYEKQYKINIIETKTPPEDVLFIRKIWRAAMNWHLNEPTFRRTPTG